MNTRSSRRRNDAKPNWSTQSKDRSRSDSPESMDSSRAQFQQLESRLRYSKTDKETAEKKQRLLLEKDLVDLQKKLHAYEVG